MSRGDWTFLENLLEEGQEYSTGIGRVWLTVLFLFRMLVLGTAVESVWDDEQADFVCNTKQPGCPAVCYDKAFPISHFRYFVLQVIFVSTPTIFYFGYVALRFGKEQKEKENKVAKDPEGGDGHDVAKRNAEEKKQEDCRTSKRADKAPVEVPKLKGKLLCAYALSILLKVFLEGGFIAGLWFLYDGFIIAPRFECKGFPCPQIVDCFVSRPTEKTVFTIYTQVIAAVSLLLNLIELFHLIQLALAHRLEKRYRLEHNDYLLRTQQIAAHMETQELQMDREPCTTGNNISLPTQGERGRYANPCESYGELAIEVNWRPEDSERDILPSYMNCMGAMRTTHTPRVHYKKNSHNTAKNPKSAHQTHSKLKHYV